MLALSKDPISTNHVCQRPGTGHRSRHPALLRTARWQTRQHFAIDIVVAECRRVLFEPQPTQPRCYVHAVILGSEERQPLMDDDIPLPFELPAAVLK